MAGGRGPSNQTTSADRAGGDAEPAELLASREVPPGRRLLTWRAPDLARRVQPGQHVTVLEPRAVGTLLPALAVAGFDRIAGTISLLLDGAPAIGLERGLGRGTGSGRAGEPAHDLGRLREGDRARLDGPLGRGFAVDPRSRHLLLICDATGIAAVRALLDEAVAGGRQVTLLLGARSAAEVPPSWLLPDEAEYVVATADGSMGHRGSIVDLLPRYEAWADQAFAAGRGELLSELADLARGRDARLGVARLGRRRGRRGSAPPPRRPSWLQVSLPLPIACALGVCLGCVVDGVGGPVRVCRDGPAFGSTDLSWERRP
jgi:dihydroorotate dehydrogenase electron transfer subunit